MLAGRISPLHTRAVLDTARPIPPQVTDAELQTVLDHLNQGFGRTCANLFCKVHAHAPEVAFKADRDAGIYVEALVCCEDLDDLVFLHARRHLIEHPIGDWRYGGL